MSLNRAVRVCVCVLVFLGQRNCGPVVRRTISPLSLNRIRHLVTETQSLLDLPLLFIQGVLNNPGMVEKLRALTYDTCEEGEEVQFVDDSSRELLAKMVYNHGNRVSKMTSELGDLVNHAPSLELEQTLAITLTSMSELQDAVSTLYQTLNPEDPEFDPESLHVNIDVSGAVDASITSQIHRFAKLLEMKARLECFAADLDGVMASLAVQQP